MNEPILACDSHHGIYSFQLLFNSLLPVYKQQAIDQLSPEDVEALETGPDHESYLDAADSLEQVEFTNPDTGEKFCIMSNEDLWFVPLSFIEDEEKMSAFMI